MNITAEHLFKEEQEDPRDFWQSKCAMFVDPGLGGTGIAIFKDIQTHQHIKAVAPEKTYALRASQRSVAWEKRANSISCEFSAIVAAWNPDLCVIEFPGLFGGSAKSYASSTRGDTFKLAYLCGLFGNGLFGLMGDVPVLCPPDVWKGQLSKKAVDFRIKRALNLKRAFPNHVSDAVGMGVAMQRCL